MAIGRIRIRLFFEQNHKLSVCLKESALLHQVRMINIKDILNSL